MQVLTKFFPIVIEDTAKVKAKVKLNRNLYWLTLRRLTQTRLTQTLLPKSRLIWTGFTLTS